MPAKGETLGKGQFVDEMELGLCPGCLHVRMIRSDRGSVFYQCLLAAVNPRFPKYPPLPVLSCAGYEMADLNAPRTD